MPNVSDDFLLAALRMVEYLEDDEQEHFEEMEHNGEPTDGHIYISVNKVRTDLVNMNIYSSPEVEERWKKHFEQVAENHARVARRVVPVDTVPGMHPFKDGN